MHPRSLLLAVLSFALGVPFASAQSVTAADTIYYDGSILTGEGLTTARPERVQAIAVAHGLVVATGNDATILAQYRGPGTTATDLHGAFAMPGFNDAHAHLGSAAETRQQIDLTGCRSLAEMLTRIQKAAVGKPAGSWLVGAGWDHTLWSGQKLPTRSDLDRVTGDHPAIFERIDGHIAVANSAALRIAGINGSSQSPPGGKIDKGPDGQPTGILRESPAVDLVDSHVPPPSDAERRAGILLVLQNAAENGVTSIQDFSNWPYFHTYETLESSGQLSARISEWIPFDLPIPQLNQKRASHPATDRWLHTTMLKGFMDGSLGSRTAAMNAPYSDDPGNSGIPRYEQAKLDQEAVARQQDHFQMGFHAIGDRAVDMALNAFAAAERGPVLPRGFPQPPNRPFHNNVMPAIRLPQYDTSHRNRIEHSQVVSPGDFARYRQLGVIASMQPSHLLTDINWAEARIGPERARYAYAWKSFLDAGVVLAFGTDYPVEPISPFRGLYASVTRENEAGTRTFHPEQRITIGQAIYAYTQGSAYAEFTEQWKGQLKPGFVADLVVLDHDLLTATPRQILGTRVLLTVAGGRVVYRRQP